MKKNGSALSLGISIVTYLSISTFIGYKTGHPVIGIFTGALLCILELLRIIVKENK